MGFKRGLACLVYFINFASVCLSDQSFSIEIGKLVLSPSTDPTWFADYALRSAKVAKNTFAVSGGFKLSKNIGNDMQITLAIYKKDTATGNFYSTPVFIISSSACKIYDELKLVDDLIAVSNFPSKGTCPIPKAHYDIDGFTIPPESLPNSIPAGEYKIELSFLKERKLIGLFDLFVDVIKE